MGRELKSALGKRILVLDGAMGTMLQGLSLQESDYRGTVFGETEVPLSGCNDLLNVTHPELIASVHEQYLEAGADIIETNTFNSNALSLSDYGLESHAYRLSRAGAEIARACVNRFSRPARPRFVAGSVGPTNRMLSMSPDVNRPEYRAITFDALAGAYREQLRGLLEGGVDVILIETVFDTLNAKAALFALSEVSAASGIRVPVMVSGTITDASGRTLSGQTVEAFYTSVSHADLLSIGLNCAFGAAQMRPYVDRLRAIARCAVSAHPNAGLPNGFGGYDQTPASMSATLEGYFKAGLVSIVGGCCGTTPAYIRAIAEVASRYPAPGLNLVHGGGEATVLSGLEPLRIAPESNFVNVGERTNVAGSAKFARLIRAGNYEEGVRIATAQVDEGAQLIDVCMDDGMIDGVGAMTEFLNRIATEPAVARVPVMIDSSDWAVLEAGLKCVQGKSVVNSISLKEGESEFLQRARLLRRYGAAAVVMLFDEAGQADTYVRKIAVAGRAYMLLRGIGFPAEDVIFDPNVLAVGTGIPEHDNYAVDFIRACRWIKQHCPGVKVSGGVSNLSFAFRGNNSVREAMHAVFLYHAIAAGMDMGIVNPGLLRIYSDIPADLLELTEDLVLNRRGDAAERLLAFAAGLKNEQPDPVHGVQPVWRSAAVADRLQYALIHGITDYIDADTAEAYAELGSPLRVVDEVLMCGMNQVGELFGSGKLFLPQVVKSARVMKQAVGWLTPYIEEQREVGGRTSAGKVLIATVKGDVHDIGKNIVSVVMACNGYEVVDLGVMVPSEVIVESVLREKPDAIGLSGLITPSLEEMIRVLRALASAGLQIPVLIGGATTSALHTAVKMAPLYPGPVIYLRDASDNVRVLSRLLGREQEAFLDQLRGEQGKLRERYLHPVSPLRYRSLTEARKNRWQLPEEAEVTVPCKLGRTVYRNYPLEEIVPYIDWSYFFKGWGLAGRFPEILEDPQKGAEARKTYQVGRQLLERIVRENLLQAHGVVGLYPANSSGDDIVVYPEITCRCERLTLPQLRNQEENDEPNRCLADYLLPEGLGTDYIGVFAVNVSEGLEELCRTFVDSGDDFQAITAKLLAHRLAEAFAELLHRKVRTELWGYAPDEHLDMETILKFRYRGIRPAYGYPACPDHSAKRELLELLHAKEEIGLSLTESFMMTPPSSVSGLMLARSGSGYFTVGKIDAEQLTDYALRRGITEEELRCLMPQHLQESESSNS